MGYKNQLVLTGNRDNVGNSIRENIGENYRLGAEIDFSLVIFKKWHWAANFTLSENKNRDYTSANDVNLGNTNISFSPNIIAGSAITFAPDNFTKLSLLSKYVGEQFLENENLEVSKLNAYFINDINFNYTFVPKKLFKEINFSLLINNIFNKKYVSNGYYSAKYMSVGYYPQAERNFLTGLTIKF